MSTLSDIRSFIADSINRSDLTTQINRAINRAIEFYEKELFFFSETTGTFSTIASQEAYGTADGLPSDIREIFLAQVTLSSTNMPTLTPRSIEWIRGMNVGRATGDPYDYAWFQNKIYLFYIPNAVKTITLFYRKSYSELSADADTNDFTVYARDLIEAHAKWDLYTHTIQDTESAAAMQAAEMIALSSLRLKTNNLTSTGNVQATSF